jgi:hypothetical protein
MVINIKFSKEESERTKLFPKNFMLRVADDDRFRKTGQVDLIPEYLKRHEERTKTPTTSSR